MKPLLYSSDVEDLLGPANPAVSTSAEPDLISTEQLADLLALTVQHVGVLARQGVVKQAGRGRFHRRASIRSYCLDMRQKATGRGVTTPLIAEKTRLAREQADKIELQNAAARGELLPATDVEASWAATLREIRAGMLALPSRLQQRLDHLTAHDVTAIDREIRDLLTELGNAGER
jgi:terminase small subunit / prophage DNA-packing protein